MKSLAAASTATAALGAQHQHESKPLTSIPAPKLRFLSPDEAILLAKLADRIIPRTNTPGASDVGAQFLIDAAVSRRAELQTAWREGLALIAKIPEDEWTRRLTAWSWEQNTAGAKFFQLLKDSVIDAYYSTREGLTQELGWNANTFLPRFDGCTHPEHQS